jgi:L-proline amide hydrolase
MPSWPRGYRASFYEVCSDLTVYYPMNGPSEFHVDGSLKDTSCRFRGQDGRNRGP